MPSIQDIRAQYPQYDDLDDAGLAAALHKKFYSDMPKAEFDKKIGLAPKFDPKPSTPPAVSPRQAEDQSMAAYEKYKDSPEAMIQSLPKPLRKAKEALRDSVTGIGQGLTFNFGDEAQAALATPLEMLRQGSLDVGKAYESALNNARGEQKLAEMRSPFANTAGQVAGGMALGGTAQSGGLTLLNAAKPTVGSMALRGAGEGAAYGGLYGFGSGEGLENRIDRGVTQGGLGAATGGLMGGIAGRSAQKAANETIPSADKIKAASQAAYKEADQAGLVISQKSFGDMVDDLAVKMQKEGMDKTLHPRALAALSRLTEAQGGTPTLAEVNTLQRVIKSAASSTDPSERRLAMMMSNKVDDWLANLKPTDVVSGDAIKAVSALNKAKELWGQQKKANLVAEAFDAADLNAASAGSGGNIDNAIRQRLKALLRSKDGRSFSQEERAAITKIIKGTPGQNLARWVGKLSPEGNGLMTMLHAVLGVGSGGLTVPLAVAGYGAKKIADSAGPRNVDALSRLIRSGGSLPSPQLLPAQQRALLGAVLSNPQPRGLLD